MKSIALSPTVYDWHPADVKAALDKKKWSFARIAREYGYAPKAPNKVLYKPWSQVEQIVAKILGVKAAEIWPSRYDRRGRPLKSATARICGKAHRVAEIKTVING